MTYVHVRDSAVYLVELHTCIDGLLGLPCLEEAAHSHLTHTHSHKHTTQVLQRVDMMGLTLPVASVLTGNSVWLSGSPLASVSRAG